nr:MAG TPA: hypothetical protein [Caudoviricetes sp.]
MRLVYKIVEPTHSFCSLRHIGQHTHLTPPSASAGEWNCGGRSSDGGSPMASESARMSSRSKPR